MKIIGLTGPSGAGKGMVSRRFEYHSVPSIDTDAVYREVITPPSECLRELVLEFGERILNADKTLDRKALASIVFSDATKEKQRKLNLITHKHILARCKELIAEHEKNGVRILLFDVPLLFESGFHSLCDVTVSVIADKNTRVIRIIERDKITEIAALSRINAQMSDDFYTSRSDYVIYNNGTLDELSREVDTIMRDLEGSLL